MKKITLILSIVIFNLSPATLYAQIEDTIAQVENVVGDAINGKKAYYRCIACHTVEKGGRHKVGPNLYGIIGQQAGTNPTYGKYSDAIKESGIIWNEDTIDLYIRNSEKFIPGNKMACGGIKDTQVRADIIAYITSFQ